MMMTPSRALAPGALFCGHVVSPDLAKAFVLMKRAAPNIVVDTAWIDDTSKRRDTLQ